MLPLGFTVWGEMSLGSLELLAKVADAAHNMGLGGRGEQNSNNQTLIQIRPIFL